MKMKMMRRLSLAVTTAAVAGLVLAAPASAVPDWFEKKLTCGVNYRCSITTNSTADTWHQINNVTTGTWPTAGVRTSSKAVPAGPAEAIATSENGTFRSGSASCFCAAGAGKCPV